MTGGQNWGQYTPNQTEVPGMPNQRGSGVNLVGYRDILDARRVQQMGKTPDAEYPDGYLGTIVDRRGDKLLKNVQSRQNQRAYQRGVHKGERIDQSDYFWTDDVNPMAALEYQARGLKWTQRGTAAERLAHFGKTEMLSPAEVAALQSQYQVSGDERPPIDPIRAAKLAQMLPNWR